jgi:hypothetical protein
MEGPRFDAFVMALTSSAHRRAAVQGIGGVALALLAAMRANSGALAQANDGGAGSTGETGQGEDRDGKKGKDNGKKSNGGKDDKKKRKRDRRRKRRQAAAGEDGGTDEGGDEGFDNSLGLGAEAKKKKAKPGPPGPQGPQGPPGPNGPLENLSNVLVQTPSLGQVLIYDDTLPSGPVWSNSNAIVLDFVRLTPADDVFRIAVNRQGKIASAGLSLQNLDDGDDATYRFPDVGDGDVTLALEEQLAFSKVSTDPLVVVADGTVGTATATCGAGSKAIGVGMDADNPMEVQSMQITSDTAVEVVARAANGATNLAAIAHCMAIP